MNVLFLILVMSISCCCWASREGPCTANTVFFSSDGKDCTCDLEGVKRCETDEEYKARLKCVPHGSVRMECNNCNCDSSGQITVCTEMMCNFVQPCKIGTTYITEGRDCLCTDRQLLNCILADEY